MPNGQRGAARKATVQAPLIERRTMPSGAPLRPRITAPQPNHRVSQPNIAQRAPINHEHLRPQANCQVKGCRPQSALPMPNAPRRESNPQINQHAAHLRRIAQAKMAQRRSVLPKLAPPLQTVARSAVVQRSESSDSEEYSVMQVSTNYGPKGHSEIFISHGYTTWRIHLTTSGGNPRIEIRMLPGEIDRTNFTDDRPYPLTEKQFNDIMKAANKIQSLMSRGYIQYTDLIPKNYKRWSESEQRGQGYTHMTCKTFTDAILIAGGVKQRYGGTRFLGLSFNAPMDF